MIFLSQIIRGLLFNLFYNVTNSVRRVVTDKKMYMVFISFHSDNFVSLGITNIVYILFYIVCDRAFEYLLAVLCDKNYKYLQAVLASVVAVVSVVHNKSLKYIDYH